MNENENDGTRFLIKRTKERNFLSSWLMLYNVNSLIEHSYKKETKLL